MPDRARALLLAALLAGSPASLAVALGEGADGRFEKRTSSNFVLYQDVDIDRRSGWRGSDRFERDVLATLEAAVRRLDAWLGLRPVRPLQVWVYDPLVFDARFGGSFRVPVAGFFAGAIHVRGGELVSQALIRTLHHELLHATLDQAAPSYAAPAWLNEGLAEWFEHRAAGLRHPSSWQWQALARSFRGGAWVPIQALSRPSLAGLPGERVSLAYLEAYALVDVLYRRGGEDGLRRLIATVVRTRDLERALRRQYRLGVLELEAALVAELG